MAVIKAFKKLPLDAVSVPQMSSSVVGRIVSITEKGVALVDFPQNGITPIAARSLLTDADRQQLTDLPASVLLTFDGADLSKPIITGIVSDTLFAPLVNKQDKVDSSKQDALIDTASKEKSFSTGLINKSTDAKIDGNTVTFDAKEEILLRCGKSSILLRKNGKIVIKGTNLISRSSASNKIKGSSVNIN
jgi:hypothetical protein